MRLESNLTGYGQIQIISPYEILHLTDMKIIRKPNDHARIYFTGIIPGEKKDSYVEKAGSRDQLEVNQSHSGKSIRTLFKGLVSKIGIKTVRGIYYLEIEGVSHTYDMDVKVKNRSFQNSSMSYNGLFNQVLSDYRDAGYIDRITGGSLIGKFIIQYEETDWEFLKRMASHFGTVLIPDVTGDKPRFWLGIPEGRKCHPEDFHYTVRKDLAGYNNTLSNFDDKITENDLISIEVESEQILNIGDTVTFHKSEMVVSEITSCLEKGILKQTCILTLISGVRQNRMNNGKLCGVSIAGKVIDRENDRLRVHLSIDMKQNKEEAYWFQYATSYTDENNSGWYCMPEMGDNVRMYFPDHCEENALILSSDRRDGKSNPMVNDPGIKYFGNTRGKLLTMEDKMLKISAKETGNGKMYIEFNREEGVKISSDREIRIISRNNLTWEAKEINIKAEDGLYMVCSSSSVIMDGEVNFKGSLVRIEATDKS
jgi:hypothetical protein